MNQDMITTQVDVLRHGMCVGGQIFRGSTDVCLNEQGVQQMKRACEKVDEPWDVIVSSPLKRCLEFAKEISEARSVPLDICQDLREMSFGDWEAQLISTIWQDQQQRMLAWSNDPSRVTPPNGEPLVQVFERVTAALSSILSRYAGQKILMVTHGGIVRVLLAKILGMPPANVNHFDVPYACLSRIAIYQSDLGERYKLIAHNIAS